MATVNVPVPHSLQVLSPDELKLYVLKAINGCCGKDVLAGILSERFNTKRKIQQVTASIKQEDIITFVYALKLVGLDVDFTQNFFLITEPFRSEITIRQY